MTPETPLERVRGFMACRDERTAVTARVHVQFDRMVDGVRSVGPGSVGLPCEGKPGHAYWALLGPDVELRRTPYDVDHALALMRATDDPRLDVIAELMLDPPSRKEVVADAERRVFAG